MAVEKAKVPEYADAIADAMRWVLEETEKAVATEVAWKEAWLMWTEAWRAREEARKVMRTAEAVEQDAAEKTKAAWKKASEMARNIRAMEAK